jgi:hypothetical protein
MTNAEVRLERFVLDLPEQAEAIWADKALASLEKWFPAATYLLEKEQFHQKPGEKIIYHCLISFLLADSMSRLYRKTKSNRH